MLDVLSTYSESPPTTHHSIDEGPSFPTPYTSPDYLLICASHIPKGEWKPTQPHFPQFRFELEIFSDEFICCIPRYKVKDTAMQLFNNISSKYSRDPNTSRILFAVNYYFKANVALSRHSVVTITETSHFIFILSPNTENLWIWMYALWMCRYV